MATVLQTSNIIWQSVNLTDELKINLEYDVQRGLLNIFVKNTDDSKQLPCHINVLSNQSEVHFTPSDIQQDLTEVICDNEIYQPEICYEISTSYVYDIIDENDNTDQIDSRQPMLISSSSSSCFDEQMIDSDDGYSTHSHDDIEQQLSLAIPSSKLIRPSFSTHSSFYPYYSEQYLSPVRRLIEQLTWFSPFKKTVQGMMMNHMFD